MTPSESEGAFFSNLPLRFQLASLVYCFGVCGFLTFLLGLNVKQMPLKSEAEIEEMNNSYDELITDDCVVSDPRTDKANKVTDSTQDCTGRELSINTNSLFLATGHSSRGVFEQLHHKKGQSRPVSIQILLYTPTHTLPHFLL